MTSAVDFFEDRRDTTAHTTAGIVTASFAILLLLLLWLIKIYTPIPPIPPDPAVPVMELSFPEGMLVGGNNMEMGGGSQGNTGKAGSQNSDPNQNSNPTPSNPGAITNPNSDAAYSPSKPTPGADASVSDETKALLEKMKNKKNNTSIKIGGDGSGSPYSSGQGDGKGIGVGPNDGGLPGQGGDGKRYRKIVFKPDIANPVQEEGVVVVKVRVRRDGTVAYAEATGSTTGNALQKSTATQSAYKILFDEDPNGPELLELTVNINFTVQK